MYRSVRIGNTGPVCRNGAAVRLSMTCDHGLANEWLQSRALNSKNTTPNSTMAIVFRSICLSSGRWIKLRRSVSFIMHFALCFLHHSFRPRFPPSLRSPSFRCSHDFRPQPNATAVFAFPQCKVNWNYSEEELQRGTALIAQAASTYDKVRLGADIDRIAQVGQTTQQSHTHSSGWSNQISIP